MHNALLNNRRAEIIQVRNAKLWKETIRNPWNEEKHSEASSSSSSSLLLLRKQKVTPNQSQLTSICFKSIFIANPIL